MRKNEKTAAPLSKYPKKKIRLQHSVDSEQQKTNITRIKQQKQQPQQQKKSVKNNNENEKYCEKERKDKER